MKKRIITFVCAVLLLASVPFIVACSGDDDALLEGSSSTDTEDVGSDFKEYVSDETINRFINEYNNQYDPDVVEFSDLRDGNSCELDKYYVEIKKNNAFEVVINATTDNPKMDGTKDLLLKVLSILDPEIKKADFEVEYEKILSEDYMKENVEFGKVLLTYVPTKKISNGQSLGHVTVSTESYEKE